MLERKNRELRRTNAILRCVGLLRVNAFAEAFNSLFKAELLRNRGPWRDIDDLEIAVAENLDWSRSPA